jgi:pilus assembly protein CpaC
MNILISPKHWCSYKTVMLILCYLFLSPAYAQASIKSKLVQPQLVQLKGGVSSGIIIAPGHTLTIHTDLPFADIVVGDAGIVDAFPLSNKTLYFQGVKGGFTNVTFYDQHRRFLGTVNIRVQIDVSRLERIILSAVPTAKIHIEGVNDRVQLTGQVSNQADMDRILELTGQFTANPVVNGLRIASAPQIELDVRILEIERRSGVTLGVQLSHPSIVSPGATTLFGGATPFGIMVSNVLQASGGRLNMVIQALEAKGLARRLANPKLITTSGTEANFLAGGEIPIAQTSTSANGTTSSGTGYRDYGVRLNFLPQMLNDGEISLRIRPEVSDVDTSISVNGQPAFISRKADTTVIMKDGQSFAIAGLLQANNDRNVEQVPWLADIPVLGALFRSARFQNKETDLVIIVTPRLVKPTAAGTAIGSPLEANRSSDMVELFLLGVLEVDDLTLSGFRAGLGATPGRRFGHMLNSGQPTSVNVSGSVNGVAAND